MNPSFKIKQLNIPLAYLIAINLALKLLMFGFMYHGQDLLAAKMSTKIVNEDFDEKSYDFIANNLIKYKTFAPPADSIYFTYNGPVNKPHVMEIFHDAFRLPGYPVFMAALYFIAGIKPYLVILVQMLISLLSVVLVYRICLLLSNNKSLASFAGLLFAVDIHSIYVASLLFADNLCNLTMLAAAYYLIKAIVKPGNTNLIISACFMALACIIRPVMILYPFVILPVFFIFSKDGWMKKIRTCFVYLLISYVFVLAWSCRNHKAYGHWGLTVQSGENLVMWNAAFTESITQHKDIDLIRADFQKKADSMNFDNTPNFFDKDAIYRKLGFAYFKQHTWAMIACQVKGGLHMFLSIGNVDIANAFGWHTEDIKGYPEISLQRISKNFSGGKEAVLALLILVLLFLQYTGAIFGMISLYRSRNYMFLLLCLFTLAYFTLVTGVVGMYRYKLPLTPFICALAGFGWYALLNRRKA